MSEAAKWVDREEYIFEIEKCSSTLTIIADACAHGAYTDTANVEPALILMAAHIEKHTKLLRDALWPDADRDEKQRSADFREYRKRFDALQKAIDDNIGICEASDALREATDSLLKRPVRSWLDIAELGIVAHDHSWNRFSQHYKMRDCPEDILRTLLLAILEYSAGDAVLHQAPAGWKPSITINN
jgi:soluble cytochrome b562